MRIAAVILTFWTWAAGAAAQTPEDLVRWIYQSRTQTARAELTGFDYIAAPTLRSQFFSRRMIRTLAANDTHGDDLASACWDFAFDIPGQDFDATEILRTLSLTSQRGDTAMTVIARFTNFGEPAEIHYDFIVEREAWRIDDVAGPGWRVSEIPCASKSQPQSVLSLREVGYCYRDGDSVLRVIVDGAGAGRFSLQSYQDSGHSCSAQGPVTAVPGGWDYAAELGGGACRIAIRVTAAQGLRLSDPEWNCKPSLCGMRAVIDGLEFPRSTQVDCADLPPE